MMEPTATPGNGARRTCSEENVSLSSPFHGRVGNGLLVQFDEGAAGQQDTGVKLRRILEPRITAAQSSDQL